MTIKFIKTDSDFIEKISRCEYDVNGSNWYYMPFWFKKVGEDVYEQHSLDDLPNEIKNRITKNSDT